MAVQILLNVCLGFMWMFLTTTYDLVAFIKGYFFGLLILFVFRNFFSSRFYLYRVYAVVKLLFIFIRELLLANIAVVKIVLTPKLHNTPGIFAYPTRLEKDWEITTLSNLITLTPGTLVVDISEDKKILFVHAVDMNDVQDEIEAIQTSFEKAIMEVSRK